MPSPVKILKTICQGCYASTVENRHNLHLGVRCVRREHPIGPEPVFAELRAAPLVATIAGVRVELQVTLWRNFQPITPPDGPPLVVSVRLPQSITAISIDRIWVLFGDQVWSGKPEQNLGSAEWVSRDGPK